MGSVTNTYTATFTPSLDGIVARTSVNEAFSTIRGGAGNSSSTGGDSTIFLQSSSTTNQFAQLWRQITLFDTTSIPVGSTIVNATLTIMVNQATIANTLGGSPTVEMVSSTPASNVALVNADYANLGTTSFASIAFASFSNSVIITSLNASGIAAVTVNGISKFGFRNNWDLNNSFTGIWASTKSTTMEWAGGGSSMPPTLTVVYTQTFPTLAITGLSSIANIQTITTS